MAERNSIQQFRPRLGPTVVGQMLIGVIRSPALLKTAAGMLMPEMFSHHVEPHLKMVWKVTLAALDKFGHQAVSETPDAFLSALRAAGADAAMAEGWSREQTEAVFGEDGFVSRAFEIPSDRFDDKITAPILQDFLQERGLSDAYRSAAQAAQLGMVAADPAATARALSEKAAMYSSVGSSPVESAAPAGWRPPKNVKIPTGVPYIDHMLTGGTRRGEVYGVLGAYGAGKTTMAIQLAVAAAEVEEWRAESDPSYKPGHIYYFHYEMSASEIRCRMWACAARIPLERIEMMEDASFSFDESSPNLTEDLVAQLNWGMPPEVRNQKWPSEAVRFNRAMGVLTRRVRQVDFTGSVRNNGTGFVPEMAAALAADAREGYRPSLVIIDYAGACVDRYTKDKDERYQALSQMGREVEHQIAVPYNCSAWLMHQLSGAANEKSATARQHHSNAEGSKRFPENVWYCFEIGTVHEQTGCRKLHISKARRSDFSRPIFLKSLGNRESGQLVRLADVSDLYSVDGAGAFVLKSARQRMKAAPAQSMSMYE